MRNTRWSETQKGWKYQFKMGRKRLLTMPLEILDLMVRLKYQKYHVVANRGKSFFEFSH